MLKKNRDILNRLKTLKAKKASMSDAQYLKELKLLRADHLAQFGDPEITERQRHVLLKLLIPIKGQS